MQHVSVIFTERGIEARTFSDLEGREKRDDETNALERHFKGWKTAR